MQENKNKLLSIYIFIFVGIVSVPAELYKAIHYTRHGWVCYSNHGHILETIFACKFEVFSGLGLGIAALAIGLYALWGRFKG